MFCLLEYSYVTLSFIPSICPTNGSIQITFTGFDWINKLTIFPWSDPDKMYRNKYGETCYVTVTDAGYNLTDAVFISLEYIPPFNIRCSLHVDDEPIYENIDEIYDDKVLLTTVEVEEFTGEIKKWLLFKGQILRPNEIITVTSTTFV